MAAQTQIIKESGSEFVIKLTNYGTTESGVVKVDVSTLTHQVAGAPLLEVSVRNVQWSTANGTVELAWDASSPVPFLELAGTGVLKPTGGEYVHIYNNSGSGKTGDIKLSTHDFGATSCYTIYIHCMKETGFDRGGDALINP